MTCQMLAKLYMHGVIYRHQFSFCLNLSGSAVCFTNEIAYYHVRLLQGIPKLCETCSLCRCYVCAHREYCFWC
ncbi:uncharacterized protein PHALS_14842 [Plasmopara halstedii]|uniref:Uncharacterized protein n=1 Tax=Plasmopara halstedii TaxID=4781 RepID=A0A0P1AWK1_PLAHL|nr:uncharacterized protein PHALS_14842 [Plasmopara halstedii]CEG45766.1 hypothetical protein PHALS_14842 [Plasmopara halstedii]|eukprot:XP_024582135.1 hypothetical protein PHALS_14842 [Plasmopara halstedii]